MKLSRNKEKVTDVESGYSNKCDVLNESNEKETKTLRLAKQNPEVKLRDRAALHRAVVEIFITGVNRNTSVAAAAAYTVY